MQGKAKALKELKYFLCNYECEQSATLQKHINSRHTEQKCKICGEDFRTSMELISQEATEHNGEGEAWDIKFQSTPNSNKEGKHSSF